MYEPNPSVAEAASWRLGSELVRRHPDLAVALGHPGGGQYDVMFVNSPRREGLFLLNRTGTIQGDWDKSVQRPIGWDEYLATEPRAFLDRLTALVGLQAPAKLPASTPRVLTYRVLATLASFGFHTPEPPIIEMGIFDTSGGMGSIEIDLANLVPTVDPSVLEPDDSFGHPGYRCWLLGSQRPVLIEQETGRGCCTSKPDPISIPTVYAAAGRNIVRTAITVAEYLDIRPVGSH
jgi:hypothetical protein